MSFCYFLLIDFDLVLKIDFYLRVIEEGDASETLLSSEEIELIEMFLVFDLVSLPLL